MAHLPIMDTAVKDTLQTLAIEPNQKTPPISAVDIMAAEPKEKSAGVTVNSAERASSNDTTSNGQGSNIPQDRSYWPQVIAVLCRHRQLLLIVVLSVVMTGWWIAGLVLHRRDKGWVVPFLVWLGITVRLWTLFPPLRRRISIGKCALTGRASSGLRYARALLTPASLSVHNDSGSGIIPGRYRHLPLVIVTVSVMLIGTFAPATTEDNTRANRAISLFGLVVFLSVFYATSRDRQNINLRAVFGGLLAQFLLGLFVLRTKVGYDIFNFVGDMAKKLLGYSADGTAFLTSKSVLSAGWFLVSVVPAIIFFVSFVQLLHYWGWISWMVGYFAAVFTRLLGISGAEAVVAAASPFIGQGESAVLVREYMAHLTQAEIHQIMTSGFASIAGSVMSAYMQMGISPLALVSSCVMSIPASIALSKLRFPETEEPVTRGHAPLRRRPQRNNEYDVEAGLPQPPHGEGESTGNDGEDDDGRVYNALHAMGSGSWLGLKIAGMVVASVLCIMALLGLVDGLLGWWGSYIQVPQLSLQLIVGYVLYPVAFLLGVDREGDQLRRVAELIGIKIVANEFVAYGNLTSQPQYAALSPRSKLIAVYALCGFGNFSAVGIQIGALTQLAPKRAGDVARVALSALITGIIATLTSASIAGMLMSGLEAGSVTQSTASG